jgi:hypothetical protein
VGGAGRAGAGGAAVGMAEDRAVTALTPQISATCPARRNIRRLSTNMNMTI